MPFLPLHDDNPTTLTPYLTVTFLVACVLVFLWQSVRGAEFDAQGVGVLESGASFWHLVDILWIALFALLYLMR